jgi:hypothetical protein
MTASKVRAEEHGGISDGSKAVGYWWRPLVDVVDAAVTPPAHRLARTNGFADVVGATTRLEVWLRRRIVRRSTWLLHQYNVPSADDIRKMRAQLETTEARLRDVSEWLEDREPAAKPRRRAAAPVRRTASKPSSGVRKPSSGANPVGSAASGD